MRAQRRSLALGVLATLLAVLATAALRDSLLTPVSAPVARGLVLVQILVAVFLVVLGRGTPLVRATWWRVLVTAYVVLTLGDVVRDAPLVSDPEVRLVVVRVAMAFGALGIGGAVTILEVKRGRRDVVDRLLDIVMVTISLSTVCWVVVVRPAASAGHLSGFDTVDLVSVVGAVIFAAALIAGATSGYLGGAAATWGAAAAACAVASDVTMLAFGSPQRPSTLALILWTLACSLLGACAVALVSTPDVGDPQRTPRWRPTGTALACALPILLYVVEAAVPQPADEPSIPDATVIGVALVLLCLGCLLRVVRAVERAEALRLQLASVARSDHLTGLANRRTAEQELRRAIGRAPLGEDTLAVVLIDLDHFKAFNDRFGHHAGDELLIEASSAWVACLGAGQLLARYGGEEFLLVTTSLPPSGLTDLVERMRGSTPRGQTFSAGLATWDGVEGPDSLVRRADRALYQAKASGRDRTCIAYSTQVLGVS